MRNVGRKLAFVLASSNHGTMIINRLDYRMSGPDRGIGVGHQLLEAAAFDPVEVELALQLSRATFVSPPVTEELRRRTAFSVLRRFSGNVLWRRALTLPPALSRRLIASPEALDKAW